MTTKPTAAEQRIKTALSHLISERHPVAIIIEPLRVEAVARAEKYAKEKVAYVRRELKAAGDDLEKCAPYPKNSWDYAARIQYELFNKLTRWRNGTHSFGQPKLADVDSNMVTRFIKDHKKRAADQYDAFIVKLCSKTGAVKTATLEGNHVWSHSLLRVVKRDGTVAVWKTQEIENVSKLGLYFPQWPSRKLKT